MGKSRRQIRAEAVERLKQPRYENLSDYVYAILGWGHEPHQAKEAKAALIDLLTDEEPPEGDAVSIMRKVATCGECTGYTMRKEVGGIDWADALLILADMIERDYVRRESDVSDTTNVIQSETNGITLDDTREKLEEDVRDLWLDEWSADKVIELLDRQSAITTRECTETSQLDCEECRSVQKRSTGVLKAKIAELKDYVSTLCESSEVSNNTIAVQLKRLAEQDRRIVEYAEKMDELQAKVDELGAENKNLLREKAESDETCESFARHWEEEKKRREELEADKRNWQDGYYLAKLTELEADRDAFVEHFEQEQDLRIKLTIENENLEAENAKLREKLSQALGHAHAIGKLGEL